MIPSVSETDRYRTDPNRRRGLLALTIFRLPSSFYLQVFFVVLRAAIRARLKFFGDEGWARSSRQIFRVCENVGMRIEITGLDHLRRLKGPVVFISNHMSTLETFLLPGTLLHFTPLTFVVKDALVKMSLFGPIMRHCNPVVVGRKNPREDLVTVMKEGVEKLKSGQSIVIFPQSTRSTVFRPDTFNTLGVKLALKAGVPVIPAVVRTDAWGSGRKIKDFGPIRPEIPVHMAFGAPMEVQGKGTEEHHEIVRFITEHLRQWGAGIEEGGAQHEEG